MGQVTLDVAEFDAIRDRKDIAETKVKELEAAQMQVVCTVVQRNSYVDYANYRSSFLPPEMKDRFKIEKIEFRNLDDIKSFIAKEEQLKRQDEIMNLNSEIKELKQKSDNYKSNIEYLKLEHEKEIQKLKDEYASEISDLKESKDLVALQNKYVKNANSYKSLVSIILNYNERSFVYRMFHKVGIFNININNL